MSMLKIFDVSGSAVSAQSQRLNVVASNLANADTVAGPDGQAYRARHVVFQTELMGAVGAAGVRVVPGAAMSGDRAIYLAALDKVREAFSPDGFLNEDAVQTAHRLVTEKLSTPAAVRAAAPAATYTNEFVLKAKQRYAA